MKRELENSGLSPEEILAKTMLLQKAMQGDNSPAFVNKTLRNALNAADISPEELTKVIQFIGFLKKSKSDVIFDCRHFLLKKHW